MVIAKILKIIVPILSVGMAIIAFLILILFIIPVYNTSQSVGNVSGTFIGDAVGTAIGSYNGITQDYRKGWDEGREQGLSAVDTEVTDISSIIQEKGDLQVLVAKVAIYDFNETGDKHAALYFFRGEAVFTVDLGEVRVDYDQNSGQYIVRIPSLKVDLNIDETEVEKKAEWQAKLFNGSSEDGYNAYINSIEQIRKNTTEYIVDYDELMAQSQEAAIKQVGMLVTNMTGKDVKVLLGGEK